MRLLIPAILVTAAACLVLAAFPARGEDVVPTDSEVLEMGRRQVGERWYGIYVMGKKVGWQHERWHMEEGRICNRIEFTLKMSFMGKENRMETSEAACFGLAPPHALVNYESRKDEDGRIVTINGKAGEKDVTYEVDTGEQKRIYSAEPDSSLLLHMVPWAAVRRMKPGDVVSSASFDELTGKKRWERVTLKGCEEKNLLGREQAVCRLHVEDETGVSLDATLTGEGTVLEGTLGPSIRIVLEDRDTAMRSDVDLLDLYSTSFIPAKGVIDYVKVQRIRRLKLKISGQSAVRLAEDPRQKVLEQGERHVILEVRSCPEAGVDASGPPDEKYRKCDADVPCDVPEFKELAGKLAGRADTPLGRSRELSKWVHRTFRYEIGSGGGTGDLILKGKSGDCTEFSKALLTLLRAAGFAARGISGVVLASGSPPSFGYHAWVEVWIEGKGWVALDPTWGGFPVDATHIVFDVDQGLSMATHLGGLSIELLEAEQSKELQGIKCD